MKTLLTILVVVCASAVQIRAAGYIVPNGIVSNYYGFPIAQHEISVLYNPTDLFYTGFLLQPQAAPNTFLFSPVVDVGVRLFFVSLNDPLNEQTILGNNYQELISGNTYNFTTPFYVGLYTGNDPSNPQPGGIYNDPIFGWARLRNVNGSIQILSSALEYQGGGILAGTQTILPVPEPSSIALVVIGAGVAGLLHWRRSARK